MYRQMTDDDPSDQEAFLKLGVLLTRNGDLSGAEQALRKAAALAPQSVDPAYYLAVALTMQGERLQTAGDRTAADKFQAAADAARRAVQLKPDHAQAQEFLGLALKQLGRRSEAIEAFRAALRCRPEDAEAHRVLGEALAEDGQDAEALVQLQYACDLAAPGDLHPPGAGPPSCGPEADVTEARTGGERWKPSREREQLRCVFSRPCPAGRCDGLSRGRRRWAWRRGPGGGRAR